MAEPIPLSEIADALGLLDGVDRRHHVAIVGGGGKTTVAFALAEQVVGTTVVTTTTKMGADQHRGFPVLLAPGDDELRTAAATSTVVVWQRIDGTKALGVAPESCDRWMALVDHLLVEADGSRQQPFKAPGALEPVVPVTATLLISVIGAHALGRVIVDRCHRPLRVAALAGCRPTERLTPARAATVLLHERGARRARPAGARFAIVVNQVDDASRPFADDLLTELARLDPSVLTVAIATTPTPNPSHPNS